MRISLFLGMVTLAITLLAGPYFSGGQIAHWHAQWVAMPAPNKAAQIPGLSTEWRVISSDYQRGFFSSELTLQLQPPARFCHAKPCAPMTTVSRIHHGPLAFGALPATQALTPTLAIAITKLDVNALLGGFGLQPPLPALDVVTRIGFLKQSQTLLGLPASSHTLSNGSQFEQAGVSGQIQHLHAQDQFRVGDYVWRAGNLKLSSVKATTLALSQIEIRRDNDREHFAAQKISMNNPARPTTSLTDVTAALGSHTQLNTDSGAELLEARIELDAKGFQQGEQAIGPLKLRMLSERIALAPLLQMQSSMKTIYAKAIPPQLQQMALQGVLLRQLPALTRAGPRLLLEEFSLGIGDELLLASFDLQMAPADNKTNDVLGFLRKLALDARIEAPAAVMQSFAAWQARQKPENSADVLLKQWVADGRLLVKDRGYRSALRLADARLTINGNASAQWAAWIAQLEAQQAQLRHQREGLAGQRLWNKSPASPADKP